MPEIGARQPGAGKRLIAGGGFVVINANDPDRIAVEIRIFRHTNLNGSPLAATTIIINDDV
ncbi:MAG TPA: hypothetical protein VLN56_05115, partial [Gammaproteobacteria bacterium]|nr:hypothetical protein [Gammaproteobacteria bacterium]